MAWKRVPLNSVAEIERATVAPEDIRDDTKYVGLEHISSAGEFLNPPEVEAGELASAKFSFTPDHLLYGKLRPYLSKIARPEFSGVCSTDILPIRPGVELTRDYLHHYLRTPQMVDLANSRSSGANLPRLSPGVLATFEVPLPPLPEQRRIAEILDRAETLRAQRRQALAQLDSLADAIFRDVFPGLDSESTRWPSVPFEELASETLLGLVRGTDAIDPAAAYPYVRMNAITRDGELDLSGCLRTDASEAEVERYQLRLGDFLFNTRNSQELVGKTALFRNDGVFLFNNNLMRVRFRADVEPEFIAAAFKTRQIKQELEYRKAGTTSVFAIYWKDLKSLPVPLPPIELQREFARRVAALQVVRARHRDSLTELNALFASLQHRAFRGEL